MPSPKFGFFTDGRTRSQNGRTRSVIQVSRCTAKSLTQNFLVKGHKLKRNWSRQVVSNTRTKKCCGAVSDAYLLTLRSVTWFLSSRSSGNVCSSLPVDNKYPWIEVRGHSPQWHRLDAAPLGFISKELCGWRPTRQFWGWFPSPHAQAMRQEWHTH